MHRLKKDQKGFTLVELIVVLVILAILAAIMIPALLGYIDRAKEQQIVLNANNVYKAAQATASEFYAHPVRIEPDSTTNFNMTDDSGYWLPITNQYTLAGKGAKLPYIKSCYDLMSGTDMPPFFAVAVISKDKRGTGKISYMTYYDVESQTVAYWDYISQTWTFENNIPAPTLTESWRYVLIQNSQKSSESFGTYYKK